MSGRRVTLVTGGARRVGAAIVRGCAARGDAIILHHGSSPADADALAAELRSGGASVHVVQADLADGNSPDLLIETALQVFGRLDVLVSSASVMRRVTFGTVTAAQWDDTAAINLRAPFLLMQAAARAMTNGGVMIQLSDHLAFETGFAHLIPHQVTKAALTQLVETVAVAVAPRIRVNAVAPGLVLAPPDMSPTAREAFLRDVPLAREGTPDDIVAAILYLIDAPYVTGVVLPVDGGRHLRR